MIVVIWLYIGMMNIIGVATMYLDKRRARTNRWRTKEKSLFTIACLGGSIGIFLGGRLFRHKTNRTSFTVGIPLIM